MEIAVFQVIILIVSAIIHEVSHGAVALALGDPTAKLAGRLTLNPLSHIDMYGSIILPLVLLITTAGQFAFGYAKPVPYNPYFLKNQKYGPAIVAAAGPLSNLSIAIFLGIILRILLSSGVIVSSSAVISLFIVAIYTNIILAVFNAVPIPPLDGAKILAPFVPLNITQSSLARWVESNGMILVICFVLFGFMILTPITSGLLFLITGLS